MSDAGFADKEEVCSARARATVRDARRRQGEKGGSRRHRRRQSRAAFPTLCSALQKACMSGDYAEALNIQDRLMPLHQAVFMEPGLVGVKFAMSELGLCADEVRLPLTPLTDFTKSNIRAALRHAGLST